MHNLRKVLVPNIKGLRRVPDRSLVLTPRDLVKSAEAVWPKHSLQDPEGLVTAETGIMSEDPK